MSSIPLGLTGREMRSVTTDNAISFLGSEDARVLATPWLIGYLEMTARNVVKPLLLDEEDTVGTHVNIRHLAAAPIGAEVQFEAEVIRIDGRRVEFRVAARSAGELIADGTHERAVVNVSRFAAKAHAKRRDVSAG